MSHLLEIHLSHAWLHVGFKPEASGLWGRVVRAWGRGEAPAYEWIRLRMPAVLSELPGVLEQALRQLGVPAGAAMAVQLGQRFCHLGLMTLGEGVVMPATSLEPTIHAWVQETMRMDPSAHIIRWQAQRGGRGFVVSCVDREVFELLRSFGTTHLLRFRSCRPALLCACDARGVDSTLVWTEATHDGRRSSTVQLVQLYRGQAQALWRGWLPPASHDVPDAALEGALQRFQAHHRIAEHNPLLRVQWPQPLLEDTAS